MVGVMLGTLLKMFLFFTLVGGIIIIFQEEIRKFEFFGRLQTTPTSSVSTPSSFFTIPRAGANPSKLIPSVGQITGNPTSGSITPVSGSFSDKGTTKVSFGGGKTVDSRFKEIKQAFQGTVINTITQGVSEYRARGFLEEVHKQYDASEYSGLIAFLDRSSPLKEKRAELEYFTLLASDSLEIPINITGWKVFDRNKRRSYPIPQGIRTFGDDATNISKNIRLDAGNIAIINTGRSPVSSSFRVNKCSGYRSQFKKFTPSVKTKCPKAIDELISNGSVSYSDNICYEIVEKVRLCNAVTSIPTGISESCVDFLENRLNEDGCVEAHRNDPDFFTNEWRIFLGINEEIWANKSNVLYLIDDKNKLVATLVYQ